MLQIPSVVDDTFSLLEELGVMPERYAHGVLRVKSPVTGEQIAGIDEADAKSTNEVIDGAHRAFLKWRAVPAPQRGEFVRLLGGELRKAKRALAELVTIEAGKIASEASGEVQEMIDICDYAVGLSRQLYGMTTVSERPEHRMMETWHPLGVVGIISAFNFPVAVWSWNAAIALVCGNSVVWKPSEKTPLTALAVQAVFEQAALQFGKVPAGLSNVLIGGCAVGEALVDDPRLPLVSATGSVAMGRGVAPAVAKRLARSILELGGNNGAIVCPSAEIDLTVRAVAFSAVGTAGQRCTSLRRLFVQEDVYGRLLPRLKAAYESITVGDPRSPATHVGPLIDERAFLNMQRALADAMANGGVIFGGERLHSDGQSGAYYVRPALVEVPAQREIVKQETFAPILYVMKYKTLEEAIRLHNDVPQGLSSSIFTNDVREAELFLSGEGSDCGIANVNLGPSGAEIGGAFGGEKETGGGREAGSDSWKAYMRRATNTINYGRQLPLAQGVQFDIT